MQLAPRDFGAVARILPELYRLRPECQFLSESTVLLREILRFDHGGWHVFDLASLSVRTLVVDSDVPLTPQRQQLVERGLSDHPFTALWPSVGNTTLLLSDFAQARRERHRAEHPELYRELDIGESMALPVTVRDGEFWGLAFSNHRFGCFTERDRCVLNLLQPHLATALSNSRQFSAIVSARAVEIPSDLTPREAEIAIWLAGGKTNWEIGVICNISVRTVEKHVERLLQKLHVENRTAAAVAIREAGVGQSRFSAEGA